MSVNQKSAEYTPHFGGSVIGPAVGKCTQCSQTQPNCPIQCVLTLGIEIRYINFCEAAWLILSNFVVVAKYSKRGQVNNSLKLFLIYTVSRLAPCRYRKYVESHYSNNFPSLSEPVWTNSYHFIWWGSPMSQQHFHIIMKLSGLRRKSQQLCIIRRVIDQCIVTKGQFYCDFNSTFLRANKLGTCQSDCWYTSMVIGYFGPGMSRHYSWGLSDVHLVPGSSIHFLYYLQAVEGW